MNVEEKRQHEQQIIGLMVRVYCRGKHKKGTCQKNEHGLCEECQNLLDYAMVRTQKCPFMATKTFCSACKVHCYTPAMREKVREVMQYAGPRMMLYHPIIAWKHCFVTLRENYKKRKGK